jgi:hypothetical protein
LKLEVRSLISEAAVLFESGEQVAADLPAYPMGAELIKAEFGLEAMGLQQAGQTVSWFAQKGQVRIGERQFLLDSARGNARMLAVAVHGPTEHAFDVLQEMWTKLSAAALDVFVSSAAPQPDFGRVQSLGKTIASTVAVVRLPHSAREYFPQVSFLEGQLASSLNDDQMTVTRDPMFRFNCEVKLSWANRNATSPLTIEPRANEPASSRLFYTRSPLKSDAHLRLVEAFAEHFAPRK